MVKPTAFVAAHGTLAAVWFAVEPSVAGDRSTATAACTSVYLQANLLAKLEANSNLRQAFQPAFA